MTETISYIPTRLKNAAIGGHVAGAEDIIDDALGKTQEEINTETDGEINNIKGGSTKSIATLDSEINGEGGIDKRLSTVEELATISIGGGDAQIATGSDFDNPDATKRAKVTTVGAVLDGMNDGVYDVSKRNPTGGENSDGKFTLEYILANANTLIPTSRRHGGMIISFVSNIDNKYVQYRLMAQDFTTDVTQWQGEDNEPKPWSENLLNSGGVYVNEKTLENKVFTSTKYTAAAGDPSNTPGQITDLDTRCYVVLDPNITNTISVPEGFLMAVYGLNDGRDGQWTYRSGAWVQTYTIENWAYAQIGVKIRKTTATDTISESERQDILTVVNNGSLESDLKEDIADLQSDVDDIASGQEDLEKTINDGNKKIVFESGDFNTETGAVIVGNTRGHAILNASNIKRIYAKGGFAVCAYGNNVPQLSGCTYWKSWASILDLSDWDYPYIIVKLRKRTPSAAIDDNELGNSAYCEIISARSDKEDMQVDKNEPHILQMVSGEIDNDALTAGTTSSNIAASDNTRGFNIISALNVDKIQTKDGFLVCAYSVDAFGLVNGVYRKAWANTLDLSNYPYNFIAIKVRKTNAQDVISDDELMNCVEVYTITTSDTTNLVEEIISPQVTYNDNYHSLTNKLIAGKKYKIELEFDGFQSSDFTNLTIPAKFITYYLTKSTVDEVSVLLFNGGNGLKIDGVNTLLYVPTSDVFYFRLSSVFKPDVLGDYSKKVIMKAYLLEEESMLTKPEIDIKDSVGINVFGDILPPLFKEKLLNLDEDLLITCVGDSLTGAVNWSGQVEDPTHAPAGHQFTDWVSRLLSVVNKNKPQNDRLDSKRSESDVFTKIGTWNITNYDTFSGKNDPNKQHPDGNGNDIWFGDFSISAQTFRSSDNNAQVQFVWDLDAHAKCNIVTAKSIDGVLSQIVIAEGNGKALVSEDRENWVEANGYQFLQRSNPTGKTDAELAEAGEAKYERHRRLWMKKVEGATATITVTYKRDNSTSYSSSYMYCWGIERYSYPAIFIDNLGRGGRPTSVLVMNTSDIFDRHPDLVLYEMPIANEQDQYLSVMKERYRLYFLSDNDNSFKTKSNNYQDVPVLLMLPHCRSQYFDDNNSAIIYTGAGGQNEDLPAYLMEKQVYGWLMKQMSSIENARMINLLDYILDESIKNFGRINVALGGDIPYGYTVDSIHLSKYGAQKYVKYLAPIFYV